jgi:phosphatidylglycerol---prolipoprotein diacylglyceryl transferase
MLVHPNFDPVAIAIGPVSVKWYGLMYLIAFGLAYWLGRRRIAQGKAGPVTVEVLDDLLFFGVLGVILGGRLGYVLFYKLSHFIQHPLEIIQIWTGGMSFHGGFLGVLVAAIFVLRKHDLGAKGVRGWFRLMDFVAPLVPTGLASGRMGNFINGELVGRTTDVPWGMRFHVNGGLTDPRHPSQLYQFALEGMLLFVLLWIYSSKPRPTAAVSAAFLTGYGVFRFIAEFFREPDDFLGLLAFKMSMGQWLSLPMIAIGVALWIWAYRTADRDTVAKP